MTDNVASHSSPDETPQRSLRAAALSNGEAVPWKDIPRLSIAGLRDTIASALSRGAHLSAFTAFPRGDAGLTLLAVLACPGEGLLELAASDLPAGATSYPSLTPDCPQAHLFERDLFERFGLRPEGHPWLEPVRFPPGGAPIGQVDFYRVEGEEVHEVAVGPVHAGVIEPGHFRFQCHGEKVFHLEISLGYQHRGVERALLGGPTKRTVHQIETVAGDSTIAHTTAYAQALEAFSGSAAPPRAQALRAVGLELERLANHVGCLGALAGDVAFLPTASYLGRLRGEFLNLTAAVCGNRFGRGLVRPGGVRFDVDAAAVAALREKLHAAGRDVKGALALLWDRPTAMARFEGTGRVSTEDARAAGLVGVAARACGLAIDARHDFPSGLFQFVQVPVSVYDSGDVFARAHVRALEVEQSLKFVDRELAALPGGSTLRPGGALAPSRLAVSLVEGFRGEVCHLALTDPSGAFAGYRIVDPSFHNWTGLALALRDQQISDFPLCNKSFDLSYCGFDL